MAWISIAKILLFIFGLVYWVTPSFNRRNDVVLNQLWTARVVLATVLAFSMSLLWTGADQELALSAFVKHGKLLEILLLVGLIRTAHEARLGIAAFAAGQTFLLFSSWLLAAGVPIGWATASGRGSEYVVFSSYLDQSIIFATTAAVFWHLRSDRLWPRWLSGLFVAAALINVFVLLIGRTGYLIAAVMLSLSAMWAMPKNFRLPTLLAAPILVLAGLYLGSAQVRENLSIMVHESQSYAIQGNDESSSGWDKNSAGWRLNAWHRSLQAIQEQPWFGHGVGSWTMTVQRLEGSTAEVTFGTVKNPHQEYFLWGVELGLGGTLLLLSFMLGIGRDARRFKSSIARATLSVLAALAIACLFNSVLYDSLIGDFFCIALGLLLALGLRTPASASSQPWSAPATARLKGAT